MKRKYILSILLVLLLVLLVGCKKDPKPEPIVPDEDDKGIVEIILEQIRFKDGNSNFTFDLDEFHLGLIELELVYSDNSKVYVTVTKDMVSEEDFLYLFLTGSFLTTINYENKNYYANVNLISENEQSKEPKVFIYYVKEEIYDGYEYVFYSGGSGKFVSFELNMILNEAVDIEVEEHFQGLFMHELTNKDLKVIYSFGKEVEGNNKLFTITSEVLLDLTYDVDESLILKLEDGEVVVEEDVRFYKR